jgi:hypothetical protein
VCWLREQVQPYPCCPRPLLNARSFECPEGRLLYALW